MQRIFQEIQEIIRGNDRFALVTHVNPDGDGIGSEIALHRLLKSLGKTSAIINGHPAPLNYAFLDPGREVELYDASRHRRVFMEAQVIFILDISNRDRLGRCGPSVHDSPAVKVCIDHHISNEKYADVNWIEVGASSTGEMVYQLIKSMSRKVELSIAEPIYVSIITDTGSFRFSNTTSLAHRITAELIDAGVDPRGIYESIYENSSIGRIKLLGLALSELKMAAGGRVAWMKVTREMMEKTRTRSQECEGFVDYLRLLENVEVCLLFIELEGGRVKVSLRSRGQIDVNRIAAEFGGGGHQHAAGLFIERNIDEMERDLVTSAERSLSLTY